jgi:4-amino-4-deoxy-L-arabinose transferase-like glycosyltransferase
MRADAVPGSRGKFTVKPHRAIVFILIVHLVICLFVLAKNARHPNTSDRLVSSDSVHYVDIAHDFASGNFSMSYVKERPHRQPLYPALLAVAMKLANGNRFYLGTVNIIVDSVAILSVYLFTIALFRQRFVAILCALALAANPFVDRQITARLLTEPLHLLMTIYAIYAFLRYLQRKDPGWLYGCAAFLGLDYLTRPNGLIMAAAAIGTMALCDLVGYLVTVRGRSPLLGFTLKFAGSYLLACAIFLGVSAPSWVPRLIYYGDPFHHGYIENYMWVDTYKEGHMGESYATYTWRDYFAHHHVRSVISRLVHGLRDVYFRIPISMERVPLLFLFSIGGVWIALRVATREYRFLCLFLILQMMPLVWTNLSNPTARVPYGSLLPFELFLAGLFLAWLGEQQRVRTWFAERFGRR